MTNLLHIFLVKNGSLLVMETEGFLRAKKFNFLAGKNVSSNSLPINCFKWQQRNILNMCGILKV